MQDYVKSVIEIINTASKEKNTDYFCLTRDIFQARLDSYISQKIAFTKQISGRAPEQRGNGLKFVAESIKEKDWFLYFQSGNACCIINKSQIDFMELDFTFTGCLAIIKTGE